MLDIMYAIPSDPSIESVLITRDCIENGSGPEITYASKTADSIGRDNEELPIEMLDLDKAEIS